MTVRIELPPLELYLSSEQIAAVRRFIGDHHSFLLTTHVHPDGDALGSELAMYHLLKQFGKEVFILNHSRTPDLYHFLDQDGLIKKYDRETHFALLESVDACLVLDIGDWERLRSVGEDLKEIRTQTGRPPILCIDHHPPEKAIGDHDIILPQASSTGEILFLLYRALDLKISPEAGEALYTAVLTDTGSFRFSNTSVYSHYMAGFLLQLGVDHRKVYRLVYENEPYSKMQLLAHLIENLHFICDRKIVWYSISKELLDRLNLEPDEVEGISDFPRRISGVEISVLLMEVEPAVTKVSLRSTGKIPINGFAQRFGGGGHPYASGALVDLPLKEAEQVITKQLEEYYRTSISEATVVPPARSGII